MTIKTQGGKVITKDGKVSCECCDPCAGPWGPGFDNRPDTIFVWNQTLYRNASCIYFLGGYTASIFNTTMIWTAFPNPNWLFTGVAATLIGFGNLSQATLFFSSFPSTLYDDALDYDDFKPLMLNAVYDRLDIEGPKFPYGTYAFTSQSGEGFATPPETIIIEEPE